MLSCFAILVKNRQRNVLKSRKQSVFAFFICALKLPLFHKTIIILDRIGQDLKTRYVLIDKLFFISFKMNI